MKRRAHLAIAAGLVLGLVACGGGSGDAGTAPGSSSSRQAAGLIQKARAAAASAESVKVSGTSTRSGRTYRYALAVQRGQGERDAVTVDGGTLRYLKVGDDAFIRVSGNTLNSELGGAAAGLAVKLHERWLAVDPAGLPAMAGSFQDILGFLGTYPTPESTLSTVVPADATLTAAGRSTVRGLAVEKVTFDAPMPTDIAADLTSQGLSAPARLTGSVLVAAIGTPYPVAVKTSAGVDFTLSKWDQPVDLTKPAKRRLITLAQVLGGTSIG